MYAQNYFFGVEASKSANYIMYILVMDLTGDIELMTIIIKHENNLIVTN